MKTFHENEAAELVQKYLELTHRHGGFPGDAAGTAQRLLALACNNAPSLACVETCSHVFASVVLAIAVMQRDLPMEGRDQCATALSTLLMAARGRQHLHSAADRELLDITRGVMVWFRCTVRPRAGVGPSHAPQAQEPEQAPTYC